MREDGRALEQKAAQKRSKIELFNCTQCPSRIRIAHWLNTSSHKIGLDYELDLRLFVCVCVCMCKIINFTQSELSVVLWSL